MATPLLHKEKGLRCQGLWAVGTRDQIPVLRPGGQLWDPGKDPALGHVTERGQEG